MENKTAWDLYKEKRFGIIENQVVDESIPEEVSTARFNICKECPLFILDKGICSECGCIMSNKTKLKSAECPVHKW